MLPPVALIPPAADLLDRAAARIVDRHRERLPDLSHITLLLPSTAALRTLRARLQRHAGGALLGPQITTLDGFAARGAQEAALSPLDCRLLLAAELESYTHLFHDQDALALADEFLVLFEQLSAQAPELAQDERRFLARIEKAYSARLDSIERETQIVHALWRAFLRQTGGRSPAVSGMRALVRAFESLGDDEHVYLIGFDELTPAQAAALRTALEAGKATLLLHGRLDGHDGAALTTLCERLRLEPPAEALADDARACWLDAIFGNGEAPLRERVPVTESAALPQLQAARGPEHEARMADLAIRRWLLEGRRDIAVVAQDRRYARRLRALLERAGVPLRDEGGWALSTSTATASLMHWLDACEQNFAFRPLLDLLKSAFFDPEQQLQPAVQALEQAIHRSGVSGGLARLAQLSDGARELLKPLEAPARKLAPGAGARPAQYWCENLLQSLQPLPLWQHWQQDEAGRVLAGALEDLHAALRKSGLRLDWSGFRRLLEHTLERATFGSEAQQGSVRLLTLEQTQGLRCDALILGGAAAGQFPGRPEAQPLFNHAVRAELGLPHWGERQRLALMRFRLLLQAAPRVLVTWAPESEGDPAQPCAWVELLQACGAPDARELAVLAGRAEVEVAPQESDLPIPAAAPRTSAAHLPDSLSASAHQQLIDCPYKFNAAVALGLQMPEEPDEPFSRSDFGERVHQILAAFEQQQPGLPAPFGTPVTTDNIPAATERLGEIAQAVFAPDLRSRALARAWLAEFLELAPRLAGWLAQRSGEWPQALPEEKLSREIAPGIKLHGRVDRLERNGAGEHSVVDYKTGAAPRADEVETGEAVQATHYALLAQDCAQVEYLSLQREAKAPVVVDGEALADARAGVRGRLIEVFAAMREGAPLPAHGDDDACRFCNYHGLCRKGAWANV